jgi:autotransporter-associated beta strand protein
MTAKSRSTGAAVLLSSLTTVLCGTAPAQQGPFVYATGSAFVSRGAARLFWRSTSTNRRPGAAARLVLALLIFGTGPVLAQTAGGTGGNGGAGTAGGAGGTGFSGAAGTSAADSANAGGGGGGGGSAGGGNGGVGGAGIGTTGGIAGTTPGENGGAGESTGLGGSGGGGGGGAGGANDFSGLSAVFPTTGALTGGKGGNGGNGGGGGGNGGGGGGGGGGGYGAVVTGANSSFSNIISVTAGAGGVGGTGGLGLQGTAGAGGGGGDGGIGIFLNDAGINLTNTNTSKGTITGGAGGGSPGAAGGAGGAGVFFSAGGTLTNQGTITGGNGGGGATNGAGGAGVIGAGLAITNSGTIMGGLAGGGGPQADAIFFTGGNNTLTLQNGSSLSGNIEIEGAGSITFNQSTAQTLSNVITGNGSIIQNGSGTLTLSGVNTYSGGTSVNTGTLSIGNANAVGNGTVTFTGNSTLEGNFTGTLLKGILIQQGVSATFGATAGNTLTLASSLQDGIFMIWEGGAGTTVHFGSSTDTGTVVLAPQGGSVTVGGALAVDGGTLKLGSNQTPTYMVDMSGGVTVGSSATPATLDLNGYAITLTNLTGTSAGTITNSGAATTLTTFNLANSTFAGVITDGASGPGGMRLHVTGTGGTILALTGSNTYTGLTTIDSRQTLQLGNGGTTGSIVSAVTDNGTLIFDRSNSYAFAGTISGTGNVQQNGSGTTILTAASSYTGPTVVNAGTLEIDGSIGNTSGVTVNSGGILSGTGMVGPTSVMDGGTLAPGSTSNPTGTLTLAGNLAFQSAAMYLITVSGANASNTQLSGTATLGGTVQASFVSGATAKTYDILHSAGLGGTTYSGVSSLSPNYAVSLSYTPTDVLLNVSAQLGGGGGLNRNQKAVANAINTAANSGATLPPNFVNIFGLTGGALANALTQLDGEAATGAEHAAFQLTNEFLALMLDPFVNGRGNAPGAPGGAALGFAPDQQTSLPPDVALAYGSIFTKAPPQNFEQRWTAWGSAFGGANRTNGDPVVGSTNTTAATYGFAGGMDYHFSPYTVAGFALAGAGTNWGLANALGTGRSDALQAGAYGISWFGPAYVAGALSFSNHWFTTDRSALGDPLSANFIGQSYGARLESGYRFTAPPTFAVTPYAAVQFQDFNTPAYSETDITGGSFGLSYAAMNGTDVRTELGSRFNAPTLIYGMPLVLYARGAWAHDFVSNPALSAAFQSLPGAGFIVNGALIPHDSALTTVGAQLYLSPRWTLIAKFDGEFANGSQTYSGSGTLRYTW